MWNSDFKGRSDKLQREQKERLERTRLRAEKEKAEKQRFAEKVRQHEEAVSRRRAAALAAEDIERQQHEDELEYNHGIWWERQLAARPISANDSAAKGIKRQEDKIQLPASASAELMSQDAPKNGTMFFQVRTASGASTHASVLEFTAAGEHVGLPRQVVNSLWPSGAIPADEQVTVTYRRLEKGTFVRLQPETADFQKAAAEVMEDVLVAAIFKRSALSRGDWIDVDVHGTNHRLKVQQLQPKHQVSVIDTDVEAEVEPSIETEQRLQEEAEQRRSKQAELERLAADALAQRQIAALEQQRRAMEQERMRQEKERSLPEEPLPGSDCTTCLVRFPDGARLTRRFRQEDPLALLFQFVDAKGGGGLSPGDYKLVTQYPRRELSCQFQGSFQQAGLEGRQQALMLEPLATVQ